MSNSIHGDGTPRGIPVLRVTAEATNENIVRVARRGAAGVVKSFTTATREEKITDG